MTRRAAVTGATGFIGTALVHHLQSLGYEVAATDLLAPRVAFRNVRFVQADIHDEHAMDSVIKGADVVFHMAAIPSVARREWQTYKKVNVEGTARIVRLSLKHKVRRIIHMSSSTVYGVPERCPVPEDGAIQPGCDYSRSKLLAEQEVLKAAQEGLSSVIIRPRVVVGPGRAGIFGLLFTCLRMNLPIPLIGGGGNLFQFTAVEDLVRACSVAAEPDTQIDGARVFNIGSDVCRPLRDELGSLIAYARSRSMTLSVPATPVRKVMHALSRWNLNPLVEEQYRIADVNFVLDTTRVKAELGFAAKHDNGYGLRTAWDWWLTRDVAPVTDLLRWWRPTTQNERQILGRKDR
jgi:nucleoside-diphosphate-sugar epimerase